MALLTPWRIPCPVLRKGQAEVEQGMIMATDIAHKDADLAIVDLTPMTTPLALDAYRMRPAFGKAAGIEGDNAIGFPQPLDHLSDQHVD